MRAFDLSITGNTRLLRKIKIESKTKTTATRGTNPILNTLDSKMIADFGLEPAAEDTP